VTWPGCPRAIGCGTGLGRWIQHRRLSAGSSSGAVLASRPARRPVRQFDDGVIVELAVAGFDQRHTQQLLTASGADEDPAGRRGGTGAREAQLCLSLACSFADLQNETCHCTYEGKNNAEKI
jgi:hypothetical protein